MKKATELEIILDWRCNNNCIMCGNREMHRMYLKKGCTDPTEKGIKKLITQYKGTIRNMSIVGGEPTISKSLFSIIDHAKQEKYTNIKVVTNGRMLANARYCKSLVSRDVELIISIHGAREETHDRITRVNGSFRQLLKGLHNLKKYAFPLSINVVITQYNCPELPDIVKKFSCYHPRVIQFCAANPSWMGEKASSVIAHMSDIKKAIRKIVENANMCKQPVQFFDIPACIIEPYQEMMQEERYREDRIIYVNEHCSFTYSETQKKEKKKRCQDCLCFRRCDGTWKEYMEDDSLYPITKVSKKRV